MCTTIIQKPFKSCLFSLSIQRFSVIFCLQVVLLRVATSSYAAAFYLGKIRVKCKRSTLERHSVCRKKRWRHTSASSQWNRWLVGEQRSEAAEKPIYLLNHQQEAKQMGIDRRDYVKNNFLIVADLKGYLKMFTELQQTSS